MERIISWFAGHPITDVCAGLFAIGALGKAAVELVTRRTPHGSSDAAITVDILRFAFAKNACDIGWTAGGLVIAGPQFNKGLEGHGRCRFDASISTIQVAIRALPKTAI
ncbi:MAG: hypothetical protein CMO60_00220 [Verrucomicrobiales bacterium]|nr:hypothetical protein [Verrucomicrobiales bacterium]